MITTLIKLSGLTCSACQKLTSKRILTIPGVSDVSVELDGKATITADKDITVDDVKRVLEGTHYEVVGNY